MHIGNTLLHVIELFMLFIGFNRHLQFRLLYFCINLDLLCSADFRILIKFIKITSPPLRKFPFCLRPILQPTKLKIFQILKLLNFLFNCNNKKLYIHIPASPLQKEDIFSLPLFLLLPHPPALIHSLKYLNFLIFLKFFFHIYTL